MQGFYSVRRGRILPKWGCFCQNGAVSAKSMEKSDIFYIVFWGIILFCFWIKAESEIVIYLSFAIILCTFLLILAKITGQEVKESEGNNQDSTRVGGESGRS